MMRLIDHLGNGWAIMGAAEALTALEQFPKLRNSPRYMELLQAGVELASLLVPVGPLGNIAHHITM